MKFRRGCHHKSCDISLIVWDNNLIVKHLTVGGGRPELTSLVPRPRGRREDGLVSTACACASIPRKTWEFVFVCKWSVNLIRIRPIHFRIIEKKQVRKRFLFV